jgi:hypothetical protein
MSEWIPVEERLPDEWGEYLVMYHEWSDGNFLPKYDSTEIRIMRYVYHDKDMESMEWLLPVCIDEKAENDTHRRVIAWMPLPKPYKAGEQG